MRASSPPPEEDVQGLLEGLCRVLSSPGRNAAARLQALHHINTLSAHSDATRNSVTTHAVVPLTTLLSDADVNVHCEAASAIGNLVHGSPARAARLIEAGVVGPLMNLLRERHPLTLTRASLASFDSACSEPAADRPASRQGGEAAPHEWRRTAEDWVTSWFFRDVSY